MSLFSLKDSTENMIHIFVFCFYFVLMIIIIAVVCDLASLQLFGGIQRYLEQFPDGGFFKGKNFVFDPRFKFYHFLAICLRGI